MERLTSRQAVLDLMNTFLKRIDEEETWKREEIVNEFYKAMYTLAVSYLSEEKYEDPYEKSL